MSEFLFLHHHPIVQRGGLASCADAFFAGNTPIVASACLRSFGMGIGASRFLDAGDPLLSFTSGSVYREKQVGFPFLDLPAGFAF